MTTTCQICGRPIKANTGKIAHHGYQRPGWGMQTSSCLGARFKPYEESCDRIPVVIRMVEDRLRNIEAALASLTSNPPETLTKHYGKGRRTETLTATRPHDFDPKSERRTYRRDAYDTIYFDRISIYEQDIRHAKGELEYLAIRNLVWNLNLYINNLNRILLWNF